MFINEKLNQDHCPYLILLKSSLKLITSNLIQKKNTFYTFNFTSILQNEVFVFFVFKSFISLLYSIISAPSAPSVKRENLSERLFLLYFTGYSSYNLIPFICYSQPYNFLYLLWFTFIQTFFVVSDQKSEQRLWTEKIFMHRLKIDVKYR